MNTEKVKTFMKNPLGLISGSEECGDDVIRICGSRKYNPNNNFDILACLVNNQVRKLCFKLIIFQRFWI